MVITQSDINLVSRSLSVATQSDSLLVINYPTYKATPSRDSMIS